MYIPISLVPCFPDTLWSSAIGGVHDTKRLLGFREMVVLTGTPERCMNAVMPFSAGDIHPPVVCTSGSNRS
jgi:hypothetical protein